VDEDLATTVPTPFPHIGSRVAPSSVPEQDLQSINVENTTQRIEEPGMRNGSPDEHPEIEIEEVKGDSVSFFPLFDLTAERLGCGQI